MLRGGAASSESETAWAESDLVTVRLNVLERQGRLEEALHLADATRQADRYVSLLVRLDRLTEARRYGLEQNSRKRTTRWSWRRCCSSMVLPRMHSRLLSMV